MILLCDEDVGTGIPHALRDVGLEALAIHGIRMGGAPDVEWLRIAGNNGWLVFSHNKKMLAVPHEKQAILDYHVGIVFLTTGEENTVNQLRLLLNRWAALEFLDKTVQRPFARFIRPNGRMTDTYNYRGTWLSIP
ncbi:MAG: DUF5615 family PIN-like protein [Chloroflexi bacterium]|nr:DUF5615 family PIN-like protein [Chloroflexota bacterium]